MNRVLDMPTSPPTCPGCNPPSLRRAARAALLLLVVCTFLIPVSARVAWAQGDPKKKLPARQEINLTTDDDMVVKATYWPSTEGKEAIPVILLHAFNGTRHDFSGLADYLQERGFAVIAPDLRGHGDSRRMRDSNQLLQAADLPPAAFASMVEDVEAVKRFLMARNNAGELNIDKLCIVGAEMGALVAANWAVTDWEWEPLAVGKQGQDVKAIVMLSPPEKFKSLQMAKPLSHPAVRSRLSFYIAVGKGKASALHDATKIHTSLKKHHPDPARTGDQDLYFDDRFNTQLQGTKLLGKEFSDYHLAANIVEFFQARAGKQPYVWKDRTLP